MAEFDLITPLESIENCSIGFKTLKWDIGVRQLMTLMTAERKMATCLNLLGRGGSRVNVQYEGDFSELQPGLHDSWIVEHFEGLKILTLDLPSHGVLSMMHPSILTFEEERHDFQPLEEQE